MEINFKYPILYTFRRCPYAMRARFAIRSSQIIVEVREIKLQEKSSEFLNLHRVNTYSPFKICQSVLPNMKKKKWGRIINISSIWGKISKEHRASYSSSKFGLDGITASLAAEVAKDCILVNSVSPGFIETELTNKILGHSGIKKMSSLVPMKRLGKPEEIAKLVIWLSSSENTYVSGQNILIDGGFNRV